MCGKGLFSESPLVLGDLWEGRSVRDSAPSDTTDLSAREQFKVWSFISFIEDLRNS